MDNLLRRVVKAKVDVCVIPTLNEAVTITDVVQKAKQFVHRVIVVDGYSRDGTPERAFKAGADVIFQEGMGKGNALRTVFDKIYGDIYVIIDGDATYDAREMGKIIKPILDDRADMVIGSRLAGKMEKGSISKVNRFGNWFFNALINLLYHAAITDSQSGFRAIKREAIEDLNLTSEGFEVETEMTIKAIKLGLRIEEVPISYARRRGTASKLSAIKAGSKILRTIINPSQKRTTPHRVLAT